MLEFLIGSFQSFMFKIKMNRYFSYQQYIFNAFMYITLLLIPKPLLEKGTELLVGNLGNNEFSLKYNHIHVNTFTSDGAVV